MALVSFGMLGLFLCLVAWMRAGVAGGVLLLGVTGF